MVGKCHLDQDVSYGKRIHIIFSSFPRIVTSFDARIIKEMRIFRRKMKPATNSSLIATGKVGSCTPEQASGSPAGSEYYIALRRRGSKLLSKLRLVKGMPFQDIHCDHRRLTRLDMTTGLDRVRSPRPQPDPPRAIDAVFLSVRLSKSQNSVTVLQTGFNCDGAADSEPRSPSQTPTPEPPTLHLSKSSPDISQHVSRKVSWHISPPTVVYRPRLSSRPSLFSIDFNQEPQGEANTSFEGNSDPVRENDSASPLSFASTAKTSLFTDSPISASDAQNRERTALSSQARSVFGPTSDGSWSQKSARGQFLDFRSLALDYMEPLKASVTTVESAAAAKIFFETYFETLDASFISPRSQRRRRFEQRLQLMAMSAEGVEHARCEWARTESEHLRQIRVLKSTSRARQQTRGGCIADYEVIRVLGKGSFGVVRLVRARVQQDPDDAPNRDRQYQVQPNDVGGSAEVGNDFHSRTPMTKFRQELFAMKVIRKSDMLRNSQEGHLRAERDFLVASEHARWVVPLFASFQDYSNLYLVMEYMIGGDFLNLLLREDVLDERTAQWYLAEMVLCIEETHRMNWIHRDVKPDNFLISSSGHLKISDFGLAFDGHWAHNQAYHNEQRYRLLGRLGVEIDGDSQDSESPAESTKRGGVAAAGHGDSRRRRPNGMNHQDCRYEDVLSQRSRRYQRSLARSVVGTSQYMAPEVIRGGPYDGRCDWWSIGVILYEVCCSPSAL